MSDFILLEAETLVFLLAVGLYLADLGHLLHTNEILLVRGSGGRWSAVTPANGFLFNRRRAVFPRLLDPGAAVLRFRWPGDPGGAPPRSLPDELDARLRSFGSLRVVCLALFAELFIGVPLFYTLPEYRWPLLVVLLLVYLQVLALVAWLLLKRRTLGLGWKDCAMIAFECLVCLPYAINFHRKVVARAVSVSGVDVVHAGERLLTADRSGRLRDYVRGALDDWLERTPADTGTAARLCAYRDRLAADRER